MRRASYQIFQTAPDAPAAVPPVLSSGTHRETAGTVVRRRAWPGAYVRRLVAGDLGGALVATVAAFALTAPTPPAISLATGVTAAALSAGWVAASFLTGCYDRDVVEERLGESGRVVRAAAWVLCAVALVSWAGRVEIPRSFVAVALPVATAVGVANRHLLRRWLRRARERGHFLKTTLLVGQPSAVTALSERLVGRPQLGYRPIGYCPPPVTVAGGSVVGLPVLGGLEDLGSITRRHDVDTVAVLPSPGLAGAALQRLRCTVAETGAELLLAPAVTGPRGRTRPVRELALLHVRRPELPAAHRVVKWVFDRIATALVLVLLAPLFVAVAVALGSTSRGPLLARQQRVGQGGRVFTLLRFRTTEPDDPERLTRVGGVLRGYSLDVLPQLLNVLKGDMSLVGPRPALRTEAPPVDGEVRWCPVVRPGLTGLRQFRRGSDPSWGASMDRELQYVENWSLLLDLAILGRTLGAVLRGDRT